MTDFLLSNFGQAVLVDPVLAGDTTFLIDSELADRFPTPGADQAFAITLWDGNPETPQEISYVTSNVAGVLTVLRAQEGTAAGNWLAGTQIRHSITAGSISNLLQSGFILGNKANYEQATEGTNDEVLMTPLSSKQAFDFRTTEVTREMLLQATVEDIRGYLGFITITLSGTGLESTFLIDTEFAYEPDLTKVFVDEVFVVPADYTFTGPDVDGLYSIVFDTPPPSGTGNIVLVLGVNFAFSVSFPGDNTVGTSALIDLSVTTTKLALGAVDTAQLADNAVTDAKLNISGLDGSIITDGTLTAAKLGPNSVTTAKILDANVTEAKLATGAVTVNKLGTGAVTEVKIGTGAVTVTKLGDGAVTEAKLGALSVTNGKLGLLSVATGNLQNSAVTTAKILDANVTDAKLATNSVTTTKILDANVTEAKLATGSVTVNKLGTGSVTTVKLADSNVTLAKMASNSVGTSQLLDNNVTQAKIGPSAVGTTELANGNVTLAKMAANSVDTTQLVDNSITTAKLGSASSIRTYLDVVSMSADEGSVGTYVFAYDDTNVARSFGSTRSGGNLRPTNSDDSPSLGSSLSGTWRCMGNTASGAGDQNVTLWRRES